MEIQLEKVAARDGVAGIVLGRHLGNVHPVIVHPHLLDQQIGSLVLPVQDQFHRDAAGSPVEGRHRRHLHRHQVPHQGTVHEIGQQHPPLVGGHSEKGLLLVEFDEIGFLGPLPGRIAPPADQAGGRVQPGKPFHAPDLQFGGDILRLGLDGHPVLGLDIDDGKPRLDRSGRIHFGKDPDGGRLDIELVSGVRIPLDDREMDFPLIVFPQPGILDNRPVRAFRIPRDDSLDIAFRRLFSACQQQFHFPERCVLVLHPEGKVGTVPRRKDQRRRADADRTHDRIVTGRSLLFRTGKAGENGQRSSVQTGFHRGLFFPGQ